MIAYFFRFLDDEGPNNWVGFALARNQDDMLWQIDEHGDPYACEVQSVTNFSFCARWDDEEDNYANHEISQACPMLADQSKWRKPPWVRQQIEDARVKRPKPEKFGYDKNALF